MKMMNMSIKKAGKIICIILIITAAIIAAVFLNRTVIQSVRPYILLPDYSKPSSGSLYDCKYGIEFVREGRRIKAYSAPGEVIWELPGEVKAQDCILADIDHDKEEELLVLCWRRGRFGKHRPTWVKHDELKWSQHIFIYEIEDSVIRPKWMASDIGMEAVSWECSDGVLSIEDTKGEESKWVWRSWGLERL